MSSAALGDVFRAEFGRAVAALARSFDGDLDLAEDAVQEAFAIAARTWPRDGVPPNPGGWIVTTARRRALDRLRRERRGRELLDQFEPGATDRREEADERLGLIFACCHPALATDAQVALTLRLLGGLSTAEVARAFLTTEPTMAQRLVRAKRKIKAARIPLRVPDGHELPDRLAGVLAVVYLAYNAAAPGSGREDLAPEAIGLARLLARLMPDEPEVLGLLALLLLTEARRPARTAPDGSLVVLSGQDRGLWDRELIAEGHALVRRCLARDQPGFYQLQAAINAVHTDAQAAADTDWRQILALYDQLLALAPTPVVALNRAVAVGEVRGPVAALELVEALELDGYHAFHATRADLLARMGREAEAGNAYARAAALAPTEGERAYLAAGGRHR